MIKLSVERKLFSSVCVHDRCWTKGHTTHTFLLTTAVSVGGWPLQRMITDINWPAISSNFTVDCGTPLLANGNASEGATTFQSSISFSCEPGYYLAEPHTATCTWNGTWTQLPTCAGNVKLLFLLHSRDDFKHKCWRSMYLA